MKQALLPVTNEPVNAILRLEEAMDVHVHVHVHALIWPAAVTHTHQLGCC